MGALTAVDLDGVDVKLARARYHLADLTGRVDRAFAFSGCTPHGAIEGTPPAWVYRLRGVPVIPAEWSAIVGDILTNLRAALDHLAWQLVLLDGQTPGSMTAFPLVDSPLGKDGQPQTVVKPDGWRRGDPGLRRADLRAAVERVQPYQFAGSGRATRDGALWQLGHLCNLDKHRQLLLVSLLPDFSQIWWGSKEGETPATASFNWERPLRDGDWLIRFDFTDQKAPPTFDGNVGRVIVALDEGPPMLRTTPIQLSMTTIVKLVEESIIDYEFRKLFP